MKTTFALIILIVSVTGMHGQSIFPDYLTTNTYLNNYVQPAPNAASLGKYADYPVSYYTGVPEINIPLYDLKDGAAHIPISLSYHASGIKVEETASWVGLGWTLNAGGIIMRTVRGAPDEGSGESLSGYPGPTGYYKDNGISTLPLLSYPGFTGQALNTWPPAPIMAGYMDTEPDLFTFNFNGITGKFVFDENRTPHMLTDGNMTISVNWSGTTFTSWMITTEDGTNYYFGENNAHELTQPSSIMNNGYVDPRSNYPSNWYLTRVVYPNTKDTITLTYTPEKYLYRDLPPESAIYDVTNVQQVCSIIHQTDILQSTINGLRLTNIKSKNYNIVLAAHTQRQDLSSVYNSPLPYSLDSVNIYTAQGQCLKRYALGHSYFTSTTGSTTALVLSMVNGLKDTSDAKRLKLTSVTEVSGDGTLSKPPYNLNYDETLQLPRRLSYDQDHWGYSNNSFGYSNYFFTPAIRHPICGADTGYGATRTPRWPDMKAFTLINMVDPLGVVTNFQYEQHSFNAGGLRIKQITATDSVTGSVKVRSFTYGAAALFNSPQYLIIPNNEYYMANAQPNNPASGTFYQGYTHTNTVTIRNMIRQSQSIVPLQDVQGNHIGYGSVLETFGARGEGGSTLYQFQTGGSYNDYSRLDMYNYTADGGFYLQGNYVAGLAGNGLFNQILPQNLEYNPSTAYYPYAPNQVSYGRGRLTVRLTYDSSGILLHSVYNNYAISYHENYLIRGFKVFRTPVISLYSTGDYTLPYYDAFTFYKLHTGISHLASSAVTDYKDGKSLTTTHYYGYESAYHTLQTRDSAINSQGDTIVKKTYYSFDYANTATPDTVFGKMSARNMLVPVATRVWKNSTLIGGTVTQYKNFATAGTDTFINPAKIYSMETTVPLTTTQAGESIALTGQFTTLLPDANFVEKADFNVDGTTGRIIEQKLVSDKDQALIWDNQAHLPLAQVDNAYFTDVAYCSFETAETGNWAFSSSSVVSDTTAPTGTKAYTLGSTAITKSGMNTAQTYIVSYWLKSGASISITGGTQSGSVSGRTLNGWTYHEIKVTGTTTLSVTGSGNVDEVRLYPSTSQMTSYTYDALMRLEATCSVNSTISYYQYDALNRVTDIKDQYGNIIKAFEYNYGRQSR